MTSNVERSEVRGDDRRVVTIAVKPGWHEHSGICRLASVYPSPNMFYIYQLTDVSSALPPLTRYNNTSSIVQLCRKCLSSTATKHNINSSSGPTWHPRQMVRNTRNRAEMRKQLQPKKHELSSQTSTLRRSRPRLMAAITQRQSCSRLSWPISTTWQAAQAFHPHNSSQDPLYVLNHARSPSSLTPSRQARWQQILHNGCKMILVSAPYNKRRHG
ncbi:hypothetical protein EDD36DRAFT_74242 [Exophiala viscosa]|uniref:Uncharacterized protein n=1 Tax=Exophiala viscosa TaxID=2486360 RepID=A0AAN6DQM3_9EURO|nr:hypothetical protein EDD36DRAFT_74242 [Exophiala viscosa]